MTDSMSVSCTNGQIADIEQKDTFNYVVTINSVTHSTRCDITVDF